MTSDIRREALVTLDEVMALSPDVRLGQLLANLGFLGEVHLDRGLGIIEDDEFLAILYRHKAELMARLGQSPDSSIHPTGAFTSVSGSPTLMDAASAVDPGR